METGGSVCAGIPPVRTYVVARRTGKVVRSLLEKDMLSIFFPPSVGLVFGVWSVRGGIRTGQDRIG